MAKRRKKKRSDKSPRRSLEKTKKRGTYPFLLIGGIILVAIILFALRGYIPFIGTGSKKGKSFSVQGGETRPVLDPLLFTGLAREAYAAAKKHPEVMNQVFCYCKCDEPPFNHKSLLSCFADNHGKG
jgi:hypothetical protein